MLEQVKQRRAKGLWWDEAWTLVEGCSYVGPGCVNCWAATASHMRRTNPSVASRHEGLTDDRGRWTGGVRFMEGDLEKPRRIKRPTVFAVWNDLFHKDVTDTQVGAAFAVMRDTPRHTYIVLTKRIGGAKCVLEDWPVLPNAYIGSSFSNQSDFDAGIGYVERLGGKGWNTVLSLEPLIAPIVDLRYVHVSQVIVGGESGSKARARPCDVEHVRTIIDECGEVEIPCFVKQLGTRLRDLWPCYFGKATPLTLKDSKGADPSEWPADLRVRELAWD